MKFQYIQGLEFQLSNSCTNPVHSLPVGIRMKQSWPSRLALIACSWFLRNRCRPNTCSNTFTMSPLWGKLRPSNWPGGPDDSESCSSSPYDPPWVADPPGSRSWSPYDLVWPVDMPGSRRSSGYDTPWYAEHNILCRNFNCYTFTYCIVVSMKNKYTIIYHCTRHYNLIMNV